MSIYLYILVMAGVTYLIRLVPLIAGSKEIKSRFIKSFLYYVPYACLAAMTFPAILYSTDYLISGLAGFAVAALLAYFEKNIVIVALSAVATVFICEQIIRWLQ